MQKVLHGPKACASRGLMADDPAQVNAEVAAGSALRRSFAALFAAVTHQARLRSGT
jgi:hypothetical protein